MLFNAEASSSGIPLKLSVVPDAERRRARRRRRECRQRRKFQEQVAMFTAGFCRLPVRRKSAGGIFYFLLMTRNTVVSGIDKLKPSMTSNDLVQKLSRVAQPEGVFCLILNVFGHACSASRTHTKGKHPVETALLAAEVRRPVIRKHVRPEHAHCSTLTLALSHTLTCLSSFCT